MEPSEEEKNIKEELVSYMRKRSETETPGYTARLKTVVDLQRKRQRAETARKNYAQGHRQSRIPNTVAKKTTDSAKDKDCQGLQQQSNSPKRRPKNEMERNVEDERLRSRSRSAEPDEACGKRRRRKPRCPCKKRRKSCGRRRRRRRSCGRRRRRRRRSCSRRRRRRSCGMRRRRRRRACR